MEKEEAMKILKDFHDKSALFSVRTALDTIIPELRTSEDEKIRKWLIEGLRKSLISSINNGFDIDMGKMALAWLEKQSEQQNERKEWSEEDDKKLRDCIHAIKNTYYVGSDELIHWLRDITNN